MFSGWSSTNLELKAPGCCGYPCAVPNYTTAHTTRAQSLCNLLQLHTLTSCFSCSVIKHYLKCVTFERLVLWCYSQRADLCTRTHTHTDRDTHRQRHTETHIYNDVNIDVKIWEEKPIRFYIKSFSRNALVPLVRTVIFSSHFISHFERQHCMHGNTSIVMSYLFYFHIFTSI